MKALSIFLLVLSVSLKIQAQEWNNYYDSDSLAIHFRLEEINDPTQGIHHKRIVFQYVNKTAAELTVSFNRVLTYSDTNEPNVQDKRYVIVLPANTTYEYDPNKTRDKSYYIFAQDVKGTIKKTLVDFQLMNVKLNE